MDAFSKEFCSFTVNSSIPNPSSSSSSPISLDSYKERSPNQCRQSPFDHLLGGSPTLGFEGDSPGINDSFSATLKFIGEVLLEEEDKPDQKNPFYHHHHPGESDSIREVEKQPVFQFSANKSNAYTVGQKRGKRNRISQFGYGIREDEEEEEGEEGEGFRRGNKHMALYADDCAPAELFDRELHWDSDSDDLTSFVQTLQSIDQNNNINISDDEEEETPVDFLTLVTKCAGAVESNDRSVSGRLLGQLRRRSSPTGDPTQRLAHYFANALETRLAAGGPTTAAEFLPIGTADMSPSDILKAYQLHVTTCPFFRMSFCYANSTIRRLASAAPRIHIIDFGILFGFQWPGLIQRLSQRPGGPPALRITGIELPQPPEKSEETRRRLLDYCARFNVPAELHVISRRWEDIKFEDLDVRGGDLVVANCMNRLRHVSDAAPGPAPGPSPRDAVLGMIRRARPTVFVHGVVSGDYNAPGLAERAAGAAGHFGPLFEAMEECGGDRHREMFERAVYGRYIENAISCEGPARVERPETYRQWEGRIVRAGFAQLPLDPHIFEAVRNTVRSSYNAGFTVERDGKWLVQGWKGKRLYALSCWKPIYN